MLFRLVCACGTKARAEVDTSRCPAWLDPMALAVRAVCRKKAWRYYGGRAGKSVVNAVCADCIHRDGGGLYIEADFAPHEVIPGTYAEDLATWNVVDADPEAA